MIWGTLGERYGKRTLYYEFDMFVKDVNLDILVTERTLYYEFDMFVKGVNLDILVTERTARKSR